MNRIMNIITKKMKRYIVAIACLPLFAACGNDKTATETVDTVIAGDTVILAESSLVFEKLTIQKVELQEFSA